MAAMGDGEREREARRIEHYGEAAPQLPDDGEYIGQDLVVKTRTDGYDCAGPIEMGYSSSRSLCLMDPRMFSQQSKYITREIRRLNPGLPRSRSVDSALVCAWCGVPPTSW